MPRRSPTRPARALLGALAFLLMGLAACAPAATASVSPTATATTPPAPTATPTPVLAPTPTNVPDGWSVLDTPHFSLAYPPGWTTQTYPQQDGSVLYNITPPTTQAPSVSVSVQEHVPDATIGGSLCGPASGDIQRTTLAGLPMTYTISGEGLLDRSWGFVNAQRTVFALAAGDAQASGATQAQDEAVLATFRPDNADPWQC